MPLIYAAQSAPFITKDTSEIRELFNPRITATCKNLSLAEATLAVGARTEKHYHPHAEEVYYFLHGNGVVEIDDEINGEIRRETVRVSTGAAVFIPANAAHQCTNVGETPLVFLCHCAPAYTHADTLLSGA